MPKIIRTFRLTDEAKLKDKDELVNQFVRDVDELEDTLSSDVETNTTNIATNTSDISTLEAAPSANVIAWGTFTTDGAGGVTLDEGKNVSSVAININNVDVTLGVTMSSTTYAILANTRNIGATSVGALNSFFDVTTTGFTMDFDYNGSDIDASTTVLTASFMVLGTTA